MTSRAVGQEGRCSLVVFTEILVSSGEIQPVQTSSTKPSSNRTALLFVPLVKTKPDDKNFNPTTA